MCEPIAPLTIVNFINSEGKFNIMERTIPTTGSTLDSWEGAELWASRGLNLAWLPREDNWHNPCLLNASLLEAVHVVNPVTPKSDRRPVWFWRVEPTFAAWVVRAILRAGGLQIALPEAYYDALPVIHAVIERERSGAWAEVERIAAQAATVKLPGMGVVNALVNHARYGLSRKWEGWEKDAAKLEASDGGAVQEPQDDDSGEKSSRRLTSSPGGRLPSGGLPGPPRGRSRTRAAVAARESTPGMFS